MKENVGTVDRVMRSVVGPAMIYLGYQTLGGKSGELKGLLSIVGGALIVESALTRVCPVNGLLGLDTRSNKEKLANQRQDRQRSGVGSYS